MSLFWTELKDTSPACHSVLGPCQRVETFLSPGVPITGSSDLMSDSMYRPTWSSRHKEYSCTLVHINSYRLKLMSMDHLGAFGKIELQFDILSHSKHIYYSDSFRTRALCFLK